MKPALRAGFLFAGKLGAGVFVSMALEGWMAWLLAHDCARFDGPLGTEFLVKAAISSNKGQTTLFSHRLELFWRGAGITHGINAEAVVAGASGWGDTFSESATRSNAPGAELIEAGEVPNRGVTRTMAPQNVRTWSILQHHLAIAGSASYEQVGWLGKPKPFWN